MVGGKSGVFSVHRRGLYNSEFTAEDFEKAIRAVPNIGANGNWFIGDEDTGVYAKGINVTGATEGQLVQISAVDENGVPTAWVPIDAPDSEKGWFLITDITLEEDPIAGSLNVTRTDSGEKFECRQIMVVLNGTSYAGGYETIRTYATDDCTGREEVASLSRLTYGVAGTAFKATVEFGLFRGLSRMLALGGQTDTGYLATSTTAQNDIIRSIKFSSYINSMWIPTGLAAGGRIAVYGRK